LCNPTYTGDGKTCTKIPIDTAARDKAESEREAQLNAVEAALASINAFSSADSPADMAARTLRIGEVTAELDTLEKTTTDLTRTEKQQATLLSKLSG